MTEPLVSIQNLKVEYIQHGQPLAALRDVSLEIEKGETLGVVGESGSGKSTLALTLMGLLPSNESRITAGRIQFGQENLLSASSEEWRRLRGRRIAMVFQDPFSALNPVLKVGTQIMETIALDGGAPDRQRPRQLLTQVQLTDTDRILNSYPHQLSGGQRQRILIAIALARQPDLLIADEPTTALDVTVQDEIVTLLKNLQCDLKMAMLFVTHNLGLINGISNNLAVMYAGQIVEYGRTKQILSRPQHPYTQGLLKCLPSLKKSKGPIPILEGQPPELTALPSGCPFHPRCSQKLESCTSEDPLPRTTRDVRVRCLLYPEN